MEELQLYSNPYCFFFIGNNVAQPDDDEPAFNTLILTFGVRLGLPYSTDVVYYRRQFSEPLPVFTNARHEPAARSKLSRMLDSVRVPHSRPGPGSDLVTEVLDGVRDVMHGVEYPPPTTLHVVVKIDATVFSLPQTLETETESYYDRPPIYLDGPGSRDYYSSQPLDHDDGFHSSGLFNHPEDSYDNGYDNFDQFEDEAQLPEFFKFEDEAVDPYLLELFNYGRDNHNNHDNKDELNGEAVDLDHDNYDYGDNNADEFNGEVDHGRRRQDFDFYWKKFYEFLRENYNNDDEPNDESLDLSQDFEFYSSNLVDYHQNNYCDGDDNAAEVNYDADDRDHDFDFYWVELSEYNGVFYNHNDEI